VRFPALAEVQMPVLANVIRELESGLVRTLLWITQQPTSTISPLRLWRTYDPARQRRGS
jgi:hypothetical protein